VTVTAESYTGNTGWSCVCVNMAREANRSLSVVPVAFFISHESCFVSFWIGAFYSIVIYVTFYTGRIATLDAVTAFAGFYVFPAEFCMETAPCINPVCYKFRLKVTAGCESSLQVSSVLMTRGAELYWVVTAFTLKAFLTRINECTLVSF
jgi:hypothetical protein